MGELNQEWCSPWRALQALLANQFGALHAGERHDAGSNDEGAFDSSWIKRARLRQTRANPTRQ